LIKSGLAFDLRFPPPHTPPPLITSRKRNIYVFRQVIYQIHTGRSLYETNEKEKAQDIPYPDLGIHSNAKMNKNIDDEKPDGKKQEAETATYSLFRQVK